VLVIVGMFHMVLAFLIERLFYFITTIKNSNSTL